MNETKNKTAGQKMRELYYEKKKNRKYSPEIKEILEKHKCDVEAFVHESRAAQKLSISLEDIERINNLARKVEILDSALSDIVKEKSNGAGYSTTVNPLL